MHKTMKNNLIIFGLPIIMFFLFMIAAKGFGLHSIPIILNQTMLPLVIGFGVAMTMRMELFDFSPGVRVVFGAVLGGMLEHKYGIPGLIVGCFAGGLIGGFIIGAMYRLLRIPAMVVSLGFILIFEIFAAKITGSSGYLKISEESSRFASYPFNLIFGAISALLFFIIIYKSTFGCHLHAVGNDEKMAKNMGIQVDRVKFYGFVVSGLFCGIASILIISYSASVTAQIGMVTLGMIFKPIIGVLIARQLTKLVDNFALTIGIGVLTISIIFNGFIALGLTDTAQNIVLGVFLITVMALSSNARSASAPIPAKQQA